MTQHKYSGMTVAEVLQYKKASIKDAALDEGSPSWDQILDVSWEEIVARAKRRISGYGTIKKLLSNAKFDKEERR